jgi:hypothetical protein
MKYLPACLPSWTKRVAPAVVLGSLLIGSALYCSGCSSAPESDPTTRALDDPMGYKPSMDDQKVSSGGIGDFDKKGFDQDVNDVFK